MIDIKGVPLQRLRALPPMPTVSGWNEIGGFTRFYIGVNISADEFKSWSAQRIADFFNGIAKVIVARGTPR